MNWVTMSPFVKNLFTKEFKRLWEDEFSFPFKEKWGKPWEWESPDKFGSVSIFFAKWRPVILKDYRSKK